MQLPSLKARDSQEYLEEERGRTTLVGAPQTARSRTPFGSYERTETAALGRFAGPRDGQPGHGADQHHAFGEFLIAADQAETRELAFEKGPGGLAQR
jgi:hypothetical protein